MFLAKRWTSSAGLASRAAGGGNGLPGIPGGGAFAAAGNPAGGAFPTGVTPVAPSDVDAAAAAAAPRC